MDEIASCNRPSAEVLVLVSGTVPLVIDAGSSSPRSTPTLEWPLNTARNSKRARRPEERQRLAGVFQTIEAAVKGVGELYLADIVQIFLSRVHHGP